MRYSFLFLFAALIIPVACQPQKSAVANSQNPDKPTSVNSFENRNAPPPDVQKTAALLPESAKLGKMLETECYSFDASDLKRNEETSKRYRYPCEASFNLGVPDYSPAFVIREYTYEETSRAEKIYEKFYLAEKFNLANEVRKNVEALKKANYTVKTSSISLGGAPAERIDAVFVCPDKLPVRNKPESNKSDERVTRCQPGAVTKSFGIIVNASEKLSDSERNKKIPGFYIGGQLNKPGQEAALEKAIKSWRWK